jgi:hypothetical protein
MTELSGTHQAALAWRRPGVRVPSGPLLLPICAFFGPAKQRFEQDPLLVGEVARVAPWGYGSLPLSGRSWTSASYPHDR